MTTKFRVETVMTTSIHLRMRSVEDRRISQTHDIIPQINRKCNTFLKKSLKNPPRYGRNLGNCLDKRASLWYNTLVWEIPDRGH